MERYRFSLAAMFRFQTMVCFFAAWPFAVATAPPPLILGSLLLLGAFLAVIAARRRRGSLGIRIRLALAFFGGAILVAGYSALAAVTVQSPAPTQGTHAWQTLDVLPPVFALAIELPFVLLAMFWMLRMWVWSANDFDEDGKQ